MDIPMMMLHGDWDEEDIMILNAAQRNPNDRPPFNLDDLDDEKCLANFRFSQDGVRILANRLLPEFIRTENRLKGSRVFCMALLLRRLVYPNRLVDLESFFGRSIADLSLLFNATLDHLFENFAFNLREFEQPWFMDHLQDFANAVHRKGGALENCVGFIDGTVRAVCRPTNNQEFIYNGHKRHHAIKYQAVMAPNGLIVNLEGPFEGRRHDAYLLDDAHTIAKLQALGDGNFCVYGDAAYPLAPVLMTPFPGDNLPPDQEAFNNSMNAGRRSVEWGFGKVLSLFAFTDFKKDQKVEQNPVGQQYFAAAFFTNCHTCLYGSQTSRYFRMNPPPLEQYLNGLFPRLVN